MSESSQRSTTPSKPPEKASQTDDSKMSAIIDRLESLAKMYGTLGIAGFLSVVGAACILFTMSVAFQTRPGDEGSTLLNVDRGEELLFVISGLLLMLAGSVLFGFRQVMKFRFEQLRVHMELTRLGATERTGSHILDKVAGGTRNEADTSTNTKVDKG